MPAAGVPIVTKVACAISGVVGLVATEAALRVAGSLLQIAFLET